MTRKPAEINTPCLHSQPFTHYRLKEPVHLLLLFLLHFWVIKFLVSAHFLHGCPPLQEILCAISNLRFLTGVYSSQSRRRLVLDRTLAREPLQEYVK